MPLISFDTSWKHQKTRGFLMFFKGGSKENSGMKWVKNSSLSFWLKLFQISEIVMMFFLFNVKSMIGGASSFLILWSSIISIRTFLWHKLYHCFCEVLPQNHWSDRLKITDVSLKCLSCYLFQFFCLSWTKHPY